jgi:polyisoprenyl-teichoic acid--peptidoglycan teichoic acid transferase
MSDLSDRRPPGSRPRTGPDGGGGHAERDWPGQGELPANRPVRPVRQPAVGLRPGAFHRRWPRRILVATNVIVATLLIAAGTVYGYVNWRFGQIKRISLPSIFRPSKPEAPGSPFTVLVVGSDSRAVLTGPGDQQFQTSGSQHVSGQRSDTIMLVHVDPKNTRASILSIPRDLWVQIPGHTYKQRINTTFDTGPDLLIRAIKEDLNIPIDHYVEVNFDSFRQVVNAVGGIKEYFPTAARDAYSLLSIPGPGCYNLTGDQALAFVRARHYEYRTARGWIPEASSDLARIKRQQNFIRKMVSKAQSSGITDPFRLNGVISAITTNLKLDSGFGQSQLLTLAKRFRSINPSNLPSTTLPTTNAVIQGNDVLLLKQPDAQQVIAQFLGQSPTAPASGLAGPVPTNVKPGDVRLSVRNGSGRTREATTVSGILRRDGFQVITYGDADNHNYATTTVRYAPGALDKAQYVASLIQGGVQLQPDATIYGVDIVLITGQSYTGLTTPGSAAPATTQAPATTAAPTTLSPGATPTTAYELPGTPAGFVPPAC